MGSKKQLAQQLADVREALEAAERKNRVLTVENEQLAAVIARDRQRVLAETAVASRTIAEAEGKSK
jgi:regulator of replication initiation timing